MTEQIPLVYMDQSFLSEMAKGKFPVLLESFKSKKMQLIYSWMHINETARCTEKQFHLQITNVLTEAGSAYLHQSTLYFDRSPQQRLEERLATQSDAGSQAVASMEQFLHKFFGGQKDKDFRQLVDDQRETFADLMSHMTRNIAALDEGDKKSLQQYIPEFETFPDVKKQQFQESTDRLLERLEADIPSPVNFNAATDFRASIKVDHVSLNKTQPPQVLEKIWEQINSTGKLLASFNSANEFLVGLFNATGEKLTMEARIFALYNLLSLVGYQADEKLSRNKKFRAALSDHTHAACGAYSQIFITSDKRMARKIFAIYEYLEIPTQVCLWGKDKCGKLTLLVGNYIYYETENFT